MKKCCSGLAVVLVSLALFGTGRAQVEFNGVINPNHHSVWVDTVILVVPPANETILPVGWGSDSTAYDTFQFADPLVWPLLVDMRVNVDTLHVQEVFPGPGNGTWYSFSLVPPPPPKVQFYGQTGVEESGAAIEPRLQLSVSPSVLVDRVTIRAQIAGRGPVRLEIVDAAGNRVRSFCASNRVVNQVWQGDDDAGRSLPEGLYFCRLAVGEASAVSKVLLAR